MQKVFFLQYRNTFLGYSKESTKSIILGFRSKDQIKRVQKCIQYTPINEPLIDEIIPNRYLIRTKYNINTTFNDTLPIETNIKGYTLYHSAVSCSLNNLTLSLVDHVHDRDDGDIELLCVKVRDINEKGPKIDDDIMRYNLEILFRNT